MPRAAKYTDEQIGLRRVVKLRLMLERDQRAKLNRTVGAIRWCWNNLWMRQLETAELQRRAYVDSVCGPDASEAQRAATSKAAFRVHPDPTSTLCNRSYMAARDGEMAPWLQDAIGVPITRAAAQFADAVKASRGLKASGGKRAVRAGRVRPKRRSDDVRAGLEWQVQGRAPLGGVSLREVVEPRTQRVKLPSLGWVRYRDAGKLVDRYLGYASAEACELTLKRDGEHYDLCLVVRGLPRPALADIVNRPVGIDVGISRPLQSSVSPDAHAGQELKIALDNIERRRRRYLRAMARRQGARRGEVKSNRFKRARGHVARLSATIARIRANWHSQIAHALTRDHDLIALEDLAVGNMTRSARGTVEEPGRGVAAKAGLNRAILAIGWSGLAARITSKAEERGRHVVRVPAAYTSQTCPHCGHVAAGNRQTQAVFACLQCGYQGNADFVAAKNIEHAGLALCTAAAHAVAGRGGRTPVARQLAAGRACETSIRAGARTNSDDPIAVGSRVLQTVDQTRVVAECPASVHSASMPDNVDRARLPAPLAALSISPDCGATCVTGQR